MVAGRFARMNSNVTDANPASTALRSVFYFTLPVHGRGIRRN